ncbi:MAG TPA: hypothetical protein VHH36_07845 [Candidatus Thermoplasmatota archaeon]|nr:hypothetical protein [Candidatus Thermoplasmatota archaeon]
MRGAPWLLPIALLLLLPAPASAQAEQPVSLALRLEGGLGLSPGATVDSPGLVEFATDAVSAAAAREGFSVTLAVVEAPAWATVVFDPPQLLIPGGTDDDPDVVYHAAAAFVLKVAASPDAPAGAIETVRVQATVASTSLTQTKTVDAEASLTTPASEAPVQLAEAPEDDAQKKTPFPLALTLLGAAAAACTRRAKKE